MKRLIFSILFVLAGVIACDWLIGEVMWWVNQHTNTTIAPKIKYMAYDADEDFVAMGTSRCNSHYVTAILEDSLGMTCYNGGIEASDNIFSHYLLLQLLLRHHIPKVICLDVMWTDCYTKDNPFVKTSYFAPYFGQNEVADSIFRLAGTHKFYKICRTYRYNARAVRSIAGIFFPSYYVFEKGYEPKSKPPHFPDTLEEMTPEEGATIDTLKLHYLQRFISQCHSNGVKLVFCISPCFNVVDKDYYKPIKELARYNSVPIIDYHSAGLYHNHPDYFLDAYHLWDKGARIFTQRLARDLKPLLDDSTATPTDPLHQSTTSHHPK